jgi:hypothetical protein
MHLAAGYSSRRQFFLVILGIRRVEIAGLARFRAANAARTLRELMPQIGWGQIGAVALDQLCNAVLTTLAANRAERRSSRSRAAAE